MAGVGSDWQGRREAYVRSRRCMCPWVWHWACFSAKDLKEHHQGCVGLHGRVVWRHVPAAELRARGLQAGLARNRHVPAGTPTSSPIPGNRAGGITWVLRPEPEQVSSPGWNACIWYCQFLSPVAIQISVRLIACRRLEKGDPFIPPLQGWKGRLWLLSATP